MGGLNTALKPMYPTTGTRSITGTSVIVLGCFRSLFWNYNKYWIKILHFFLSFKSFCIIAENIIGSFLKGWWGFKFFVVCCVKTLFLVYHKACFHSIIQTFCSQFSKWLRIKSFRYQIGNVTCISRNMLRLHMVGGSTHPGFFFINKWHYRKSYNYLTNFNKT